MGSHTACSVITNTEGTQCTSDDQCSAKFAHTKCGSEGVCVPECTSSVECAPNGVQTPGDERVCSNKQCVKLRSDECFAVVDGALAADGKSPILPGEAGAASVSEGLKNYQPDIGVDPIVFGYVSDIFEGEGSYFTDSVAPDGVMLALSQIKSNVLQFPGKSTDRKIVVLACGQTKSGVSTATTVAQHLVDVGAKAIIGPTSESRSAEVVAVTSQAKPRIPIISSWLVGRSAAAASGADGLVWLPAAQREDAIAPLQAKLKEVEAQLKPKLASGKSLRVVAVFDDAAQDGGYDKYKALVNSGLSFNDTDVATNRNDTTDRCKATGGTVSGCYLELSTLAASGPKTKETLAAEIRAFRPDVIIPFTDVTISGSLPTAVEKAKYDSGERRPSWLVPFNLVEYAVYKSATTYTTPSDAQSAVGYGYNIPKADDISLIQSDGGVPEGTESPFTRVQGIHIYKGSATAGSSDYGVFFTDYGDKSVGFSRIPKGFDESRPAARAYEDTMLAFYAAYHAAKEAFDSGKDDFDGEDMVAAIPFVTDQSADADSRTVGSKKADLASAAGLTYLQQGKTIRLRGLLSTFAFDPSTGVTDGQWSDWFVKPDGTTSTTLPLPSDPKKTVTVALESYKYTELSGCYDRTRKAFSPCK